MRALRLLIVTSACYTECSGRGEPQLSDVSLDYFRQAVNTIGKFKRCPIIAFGYEWNEGEAVVTMLISLDWGT